MNKYKILIDLFNVKFSITLIFTFFGEKLTRNSNFDMASSKLDKSLKLFQKKSRNKLDETHDIQNTFYHFNCIQT